MSSSSSKQHLKAERAQLVYRGVCDLILGQRRQHGRDEGREALGLQRMLVWGRVEGREGRKRGSVSFHLAASKPIVATGADIYVRAYLPYRVVGLAPTRRRCVRFVQRQLDSLRVCLRRRGRDFLVLFWWQDVGLLAVVGGIWELEEGHVFVC
jgi:hypothetical protein